MFASTPRAAGSALLTKPRMVLLATVAVLGAGVVLSDYGFAPKSGGALFAPAYAQAQNAQRQ